MSVLAFALLASFLTAPPSRAADAVAPAATKTIAVSSPSFAFSPGNWTGDNGRIGDTFRQTWTSGAYFRVTWQSALKPQTAKLLLDTSQYGDTVKTRPTITYCIDSKWVADVPSADSIDITVPAHGDTHVLTVYLQNSAQSERWGKPGESGHNVLRVTGLQVDSAATLLPAARSSKWILEVGDSITEGIGTSGNLDDYSYFIGQAMRTRGYEYCVSACGWSGWLQYGDRPKDVLPYYFVSGSSNGEGGKYDPAQSRWDKIDGNNHSVLDSKGHISGWGGTDQEPAMILINYGTNDAFFDANPSDLRASITQALSALRKAAPSAKIYLIVPFEQFSAEPVKAAFAKYKAANAQDNDTILIDLGNEPALSLRTGGFYGDIHPNMRGHAVFATQLLAAILGK
jgi:hypothetical protein